MQANHSTPNAAIYVRVSSAGQEDGYSLDTQEQACRAHVTEHGYRLDERHVYRETHTGQDLYERPALTALRTAVADGQVDVVIAYAVDRLSRKQAHIAIIMDGIERGGGRIEFVAETFEDTAIGRFILAAKSFKAELELEDLRERSGRGRHGRAREGKLLPGSRPLFGYAWRMEMNKKLKPVAAGYCEDPATAPLAQRIFREAAEGRTLRGIAASLDADGIRPAGGAAHWRRSTLHEMLTNRAYIGEAVFNQTKRVTYLRDGTKVKTQVKRPEEEWIRLPEGTIPALVDAETFETVQARLAANHKRHMGRTPDDPEAALLRGGYGVCGACGGPLYVAKYRSKPHYRCSRNALHRDLCPGAYMLCAELDARVWSDLSEDIGHPERIQRRLARRQEPSLAAGDLAAVDKKIAEAERRRSNLLARLADVDDPDIAAAYETKIAEFTHARRLHEAERAHLLAAQAATDRAQARTRELTDWCAHVGARLTNATYEIKRSALEWLDVRVRLFRSDAPDRYLIEAVPVDEDGVIVSVSAS